MAHFSVAKSVEMNIGVFAGTVLREVCMSRRQEQVFKIVAGLAVVGAFVIAMVMAVELL